MAQQTNTPTKPYSDRSSTVRTPNITSPRKPRDKGSD